MRILNSKIIQEEVAWLCIKANTQLRSDVLFKLKAAYQRETKARARDLLKAIIKNSEFARRNSLAICQDTGLPCVFVELGNKLKIAGDLRMAINKGVERGYKKGYLRNSIVNNPLIRKKPDYKPAVIHFELVKGDRLRLTVLPKGFGCENKSRLKMFVPTASIDQIKQFIVESVIEAGPDACPPYIIGLGIGGTADYAGYLAKKALLNKITGKPSRFEQDILRKLNKLNIGPMGLGGRTTCLGVSVQTYPTHIAGLPVAVNISCHALRSATKIL